MALATRPKPNTHARKRQAGHHRHSQQYLRHYWPYLPMLLIVGLGLLVNSAWSSGKVLGSQSTDFSASALLTETNAERQRQNEQPLTIDSRLAAAAQAKAEDMAANNYWAHTSPDGKTPWTFITGSGYQYRSAGENLAYGFANADQSIAGWMASPEHRNNMLNAAYQNVGFGVASASNYLGQGPETIVVAEYAQPAAAPGSASSQVLGSETGSQPVSRIQLLAGDNAEWALVAVVALSGGAMALFLLRHGYRFHRWLNKGGIFVVQHPVFDVAIVVVIVAGAVLTRSSGLIR
jgi:uncharacterized protein YkwD